jgi:hypothetical protein
LSFEAGRQEAEQEEREGKKERERVRKEWRKKEKAGIAAEERSRILLKLYFGRCSMFKSW